MVFVTGDTHGNFERFKPEYFPEQAQMTKDDVSSSQAPLEECGTAKRKSKRLWTGWNSYPSQWHLCRAITKTSTV